MWKFQVFLPWLGHSANYNWELEQNPNRHQELGQSANYFESLDIVVRIIIESLDVDRLRIIIGSLDRVQITLKVWT